MDHDAITKKLHEQLGVSVYPYQQKWVDDDSRFKIVLKARQTGFSFGVALEVVLDAMERPANWVLLSAGERQSKELMSKVRGFAQMFGALRQFLEEDFRGDEGTYKQLEVVLPNGSRIIGLPANPDTARGFSGNVVLDEFAFHKDSRAIWRALFPIVSRGYKLRIVSTPNGKSNQYYDLWMDDTGRWSKHYVDIYLAVEQGLPFDIDEAREAINDPDAWAQEYECKFLDAATALLTFDLIASCQSQDVIEQMPELVELVRRGPLALGVDIARRGDLTVMWLLEKVGDVFWTVGITPLRNTKFAVQRDILYGLLGLSGLHQACIDETGIGMQLAEEAQDAFGGKVEPVYFTPMNRAEMAITALRAFQDRQVRVPTSLAVRDDLHSVQKRTTSNGNVRYVAPRTADGHADHFWALALAVRAGKAEAGPIRVHSAPRAMQGYLEGYGGYAV